MPSLIKRSLGPSPFVQRRGRPAWVLGDVDFDFANNRFWSAIDGETTITGASGFALNSATLSSGLVVGGGSPSLVLATQGITFPLTIRVIFTTPGSFSGFPAVYTFDNSVSGGQMARSFYNAASTTLIVRQDKADGTQVAGFGLGTLSTGTQFTLAVSHSDADMAGAIGGSGNSDTPSEALLALDRLGIGNNDGGNAWGGSIQSVAIWLGAMTQAELEALTT